jgi:hypothetical protein
MNEYCGRCNCVCPSEDRVEVASISVAFSYFRNMPVPEFRSYHPRLTSLLPSGGPLTPDRNNGENIYLFRA